MQIYQYKLDVDGARYEKVNGGFSFELSGSKCYEVKNRETGKTYLLSELVDAKGVLHYDIMSFENWSVIRHNGDFLAKMCIKFSEGAKARVEASKAALAEKAKTLKGAGMTSAEIQAVLISRGNAKADVEAVVKTL